LNRVGRLALACCALIAIVDVRAESSPGIDIERSIILSLLLSQDAEVSRLGAKMIGHRYPFDDAMCDYVAERLLKGTESADSVEVDAIAWYANTLRYTCSERYQNALTLSRQRYTNEKIVTHIDAALATHVAVELEQYAEDGIDLLASEAEFQRQLKTFAPPVRGSFRSFPQGTTFGTVVRSVGAPVSLHEQTLHVGDWTHLAVLVAHYRGTGMLLFRTRPDNQWVLVATLRELVYVDETLESKKFAIAQSLTCLRGDNFRAYVKQHGREIRQDLDLLWVLTNRLSRITVPVDRFEEDGMLVAVKLIVNSRKPESWTMLKQIGASPGEKVPESARAYLSTLERRGLLRAPEAE
jgi:hypothetical protein